MSDENKITPEEAIAHMERDALREKKRKEVLDKELIVKDHRLDTELQRLALAEKEQATVKNTDYGTMSDADVEKLKQENTSYMLAAREKMRFINQEFDDAIPFYRKNLILVGGATGDGKSTTAANIITTVFRQSAEGGRKRRVLVLTNEEKTEDVYNRVVCLLKGWAYVNHDKFTDEQIEFFNNSYQHLRKYITVVDNFFGGGFMVTTSLEGICGVFDNLLARSEYYDVVIIDYYQNVHHSNSDPRMDPFKVQAELAKRLDQYKNVYPAPIVLLAQVRPPDDSNTPFKIRVEGSKAINNVCTCSVELIANKQERRTDWVIHKSRFNEAVGANIQTGFSMGRHVLYDDAFRETVAKMIAARDTKQFDKNVKMPIVMEEEPK